MVRDMVKKDKVRAVLDYNRQTDFEADFTNDLADRSISGECYDACCGALDGSKVMMIKQREGDDYYVVTVDDHDCLCMFHRSELELIDG